MKLVRTFVAAIAIGLLFTLYCPADDLKISKNDHICIVGNTLAERMQHDGWLETALFHRFPQSDLVIRNLGFSGDELALRLRSQDFGTPDQHLEFNRAAFTELGRVDVYQHLEHSEAWVRRGVQDWRARVMPACRGEHTALTVEHIPAGAFGVRGVVIVDAPEFHAEPQVEAVISEHAVGLRVEAVAHPFVPGDAGQQLQRAAVLERHKRRVQVGSGPVGVTEQFSGKVQAAFDHFDLHTLGWLERAAFNSA